MVDKLICPQCHFENEVNASVCKICGADLSHMTSQNEPVPDWLSYLRDAENEEESKSEINLTGSLFSAGDESDDSEDSGNDEVDWLKRITTKENKEKLENNKDSVSTEDDWTSSPEIESNDQTKLISNDWLVDFREESGNVNNNKQSEDTEENLNLDWLEKSSGENKPEDTFTLEDLTKDWQKEFSEQIGLNGVEGIEPATELPQWLNHNKNSSVDEPTNEESDIPNWLNSSYNQPQNEDDPEDQVSNLPDWLSTSNLSSKDGQLLQEDLEEHDQEIQNIPDWITEINQKMGGGDTNKAPENDEAESSGGDQFDSRLLFNKLDMSPQISDDKTNKSEKQEEVSSEISQEERIEFKEPAFLLDPDEAENLPVKPFIDFDETENWEEELSKISSLKALEKYDHKDETDQQIASPIGSPPPFTFGDIPSWMDDIDFDEQMFADLEQKVEEPKQNVTIAEDLEKANLPEWLKAIRPVEVVTPKIQKNAQKQVEKSGPLAGLQGVLSSEGMTKSYTKPPTYSVSINVTDKQKGHIQLLEDILNPPLTVKTVTKKNKSRLSSIENYLVPLFLLIIVLTSLFIDQSNVKIPKTFPADAVRFYNLATTYLLRNATPSHVLVIFESDASSYPELNLISDGFFESLFKNNHWITTLSTNPNGVLIADEILSNTQFKVPSYNIEERVHNLGYLPGNIVGIQSFISNPRILSNGLDTKSKIWEEEPLSNINSFLDFDMIVILTDNSDQAKLWIEQMNLTVPDSSLLFISTAKASPLLQPYLETNQIDGILSGIIGGISFDLLSNASTNEISRMWFINQLAVAVFILLILAGGVISLFSSAASSKPLQDKNK